jgi:hypothetical protein
MRRFAAFALTLAAWACARGPGPSAAAPDASPPAAAPLPPPVTAPAPVAAAPVAAPDAGLEPGFTRMDRPPEPPNPFENPNTRALRDGALASLTDEKLAKFAVYDREMLPTLALGKEISDKLRAANVKDPEGMRKAVQGDDRFRKIQAARVEAQRKSGLTTGEIGGLTLVVSDYYGKRYALQRAEKKLLEVRGRLSEAKAGGKLPNPIDVSMELTLVGERDRRKAELDRTVAGYPPEARKVLDKHEAEFIAIMEARLDVSLGKPLPGK